jgi:hypothetical protein
VIRKFALWIKVSLNSIYLKVRHNSFWPGVADIIMLEFIKVNTDHYAKTLEKTEKNITCGQDSEVEFQCLGMWCMVMSQCPHS